MTTAFRALGALRALLASGAILALTASGLLVTATPVLAQTPVNMPGSTLPQPLYLDVVPFGFNYYGTSNGAAKTAFLTNNFGGIVPVHLAAVESRLTTAEVSTYNSAYNNGASSTVANYGRLIQIPAFITPLLLPYKEAGVTALNLSTEQVCRIFSYDPAARNWSQVTSFADDGGVGSVSAIELVYPQESSGMTELLSRFLNAACGPYLPSGKFFTVSNNFSTVVATALPTLTAAEDANGNGLPDVWVPVTGSAGMNAALQGNHRLGFQSPHPWYTGGTNDVVARINGYLPQPEALRAGMPAPPTTAITRANPLNWVPAYALPASSYPIFGTSNLLVGQCYAGGAGTGTAANAVKLLISQMVGGAWPQDQYGFASLPATWRTAITQAFLTSGSTLEIGSTSVCAGIGR